MPAGVSAVISVSTQVALGIVIVSASTAVLPAVKRSRLATPWPITAVFLPPPEFETPPPAPPEETAATEVPAPAPELPAPVPVRNFETPPVPTPKVAEIRPVIEPPRPAPESPKPTIGAFPSAVAVARTPEPVARVEAAGFDVPLPKAPESRSGIAKVGAFDTAQAPGPRQMGTTERVVEGGFNQASAAAPQSQQSRVIRETGFGASSSPEQPRAQEPAVPKSAGFADARVAEPVRRATFAQQAPAIVPVEVLSKPTPAYTEEARRLKIEGEVVLEVEFAATGSVRVVRVVRGLGHGLDESATVAARQIQFKPAQNGGRPVDFRTTVHIVFRLA